MLDGQSVLVSGGGRGIGAAICRALAAAGARVWVAGRDRAGAEALAAELRAGGARADGLELDVTERASVARARERAGALDALVNNAGVAESAPLLARDA